MIQAPIGVFDSGMGGLTVLRALQAQMPGESFLYLGDTARLPYGSKSPATVQRYAVQAARILVDRGVRALVVACNTASAFALDALNASFPSLPVFGVVAPGAEAVVESPDAGPVLVLATESTVAGGAYQREILSRRGDLSVHARPCPLLVALAEEGEYAGEFCESVLRHYLHGFVDQASIAAPATVLLGCTHFPVFREALGGLLGAHAVRIVDSADTTARVVADALAPVGTEPAGGDGGVTLLATDGVMRFRRVGRHFLGAAIESVELVDL
ncbi:MAG: glutamate racemase [Gammaproteobacteria bacterium]|nr:glutamate racemase [Gammaproteobacteria bacterium]